MWRWWAWSCEFSRVILLSIPSLSPFLVSDPFSLLALVFLTPRIRLPELTTLTMWWISNGEERPRAYIVRKSEVTPPVTADEIINHVKEQCTQYKWITGGVVFVDEIPKNPSGKILRKVLRERAAREVATEGKAKL